jgi:CRP/FNR family cyclic AMP-dependent transcriptional regulator
MGPDIAGVSLAGTVGGWSVLEQIPLFAKVPQEHLAAVERRGVLRRYPKGTIVVMEEDSPTQLFVIRAGRVRVYADGPDGKHVVLHHLGPGEHFGEFALVDDDPHFASVVTVTACELLTIPGELFRELLSDHPGLRQELMRRMVATIRTLTSHVKELALLDVYRRVARVLERLDSTAHFAGEFRLTHQEIAAMTGASREMVGKIIKDLRRGDYIDQSGGRIQIKRPLPARW